MKRLSERERWILKNLSNLSTKRLLCIFRKYRSIVFNSICNCGCNEVAEDKMSQWRKYKRITNILKKELDKRENIK